jgi:ABC-type nitrate/sulfonate/bicarbonate transport system substrate-binding protein
MADRVDAWRAEGLAVQTLVYQGGGALARGVLAGEVEAGVVDPAVVAQIRSQGAPVRIAARTANAGPHWALAARRGRFAGPADLRGRRIAVTSRGASTHVFAIELLRGAGLSADDVAWVSTGSGMLEALLAHEVDAAMLAPGRYAEALAHPVDVLASSAEHAALRDYPAQVWFFTERMLAAEDRLPERVLRAYYTGARHVLDDPEAARVLAEQEFGWPRNLAADFLRDNLPYVSSDGALDPARIAAAVALAHRLGFLPSPVAPDLLADLLG